MTLVGGLERLATAETRCLRQGDYLDEQEQTAQILQRNEELRPIPQPTRAKGRY